MLNWFELAVYENPGLAAIAIGLMVFLFMVVVGDELTKPKMVVSFAAQHTDGRATRNQGKKWANRSSGPSK